jgi:WD40 repeat protein
MLNIKVTVLLSTKWVSYRYFLTFTAYNKKKDSIFVSASQDGTVKIWDERLKQFIHSIKSDKASPFYSVSYHETVDGVFACGTSLETLMIGGEEGILLIYDERNLKESMKVRFSLVALIAEFGT